MTLLTIDTNTGEVIKPRYRFRLNLVTGKVECINSQWPPVAKPAQPTEQLVQQVSPKREPRPPATFSFKVATFPSIPCVCPKCVGRGIIISQATRKPLGVCFWCDGKGRLDEADLANQQRRQRLGLATDHRCSL